MSTQVTNPFGNRDNQGQSGGVMAVEQERAIQEVQAALVIAKRFPRDPIASMDKILQACTRETLADSALYSYSRGGTEVTGPSIRLAEAMAQNWGNIQFGIRELEQRNNASVVEAFAWDIETNVRQVKTFTVPHVRDTKKGKKNLTEARDIYEMVANQGSRRLRACILGVIPGDVTEAAVRQCEITQSSTVDVSPESIKKLLSTFLSEFRVTQAQIEKRIQRRIESIRPAQFLQLRKIYQSLRDGMSGPEDWFDSDGSSPVPATTTFSHPGNDVATGNVEEEKPVEQPASDNDWYTAFTHRIADAANTSETEALQRELEDQKHTIDINQYSELKGKITRQKFRLSAVDRIERLFKDLPRPGEPDAAAKFATLESALNASKPHLAELHEAYSIRLSDMKPEYIG
ncbi:hypothetical protein NPF39_000991 [Salmonella enterica subsp. enterica serovar Uganda]|nr:hypothetical protein [Salmonella enterica subsp. enterica serovar Uganda]HEH9008898.1 hypothetical protein [Salmonella enterica]